MAEVQKENTAPTASIDGKPEATVNSLPLLDVFSPTTTASAASFSSSPGDAPPLSTRRSARQRVDEGGKSRSKIVMDFVNDAEAQDLLEVGPFNAAFNPDDPEADNPEAARPDAVLTSTAFARPVKSLKEVDLNETLLRAAYCGENLVLHACLSKGASIVHRHPCGRTALHYAAANNQRETAVKILEVIRRDFPGEVADFVNIRDLKNWTSLHIAVCKDFVGTAEFLLQAGADVHMALNHNSFPCRESQSSSFPIHFAAVRSNTAMARLLLDTTDSTADARDEHGRVPLHYAMGKGNLEFISFLLVRAPNAVKVQDIHGRTPLHAAAIRCSVEVVKLILEAEGGADVMAVSDIWDSKPLGLAQAANNSAVADLLREEMIARGIDISEVETGEVEATFNATEKALLETLTTVLQEKNRAQLARCIKRLGPATCLTVLKETVEIQNRGGMLSGSGKRNKTAGGVFFYVIQQKVAAGEMAREDWTYISKERKEAEKAAKLRQKSSSRLTLTSETRQVPPQDVPDGTSPVNASKSPLGHFGEPLERDGRFAANESVYMSKADGEHMSQQASPPHPLSLGSTGRQRSASVHAHSKTTKKSISGRLEIEKFINETITGPVPPQRPAKAVLSGFAAPVTRTIGTSTIAALTSPSGSRCSGSATRGDPRRSTGFPQSPRHVATPKSKQSTSTFSQGPSASGRRTGRVALPTTPSNGGLASGFGSRRMVSQPPPSFRGNGTGTGSPRSPQLVNGSAGRSSKSCKGAQSSTMCSTASSILRGGGQKSGVGSQANGLKKEVVVVAGEGGLQTSTTAASTISTADDVAKTTDLETGDREGGTVMFTSNPSAGEGTAKAEKKSFVGDEDGLSLDLGSEELSE